MKENYVDQELIEIKWWPSSFMLQDYLHKDSNGELIGRCVCNKHYEYYRKVNNSITCDENTKVEFRKSTIEQVLSQVKKLNGLDE